MIAAKESILSRLQKQEAVIMFDTLIQCCRAFIPNEDDPMVVHLRDSYINEIMLKEDEIPTPSTHFSFLALEMPFFLFV